MLGAITNATRCPSCGHLLFAPGVSSRASATAAGNTDAQVNDVVIKIHPEREASAYMEWDPDFNDVAKIPTDLPGMPPAITGLSIDDMQKGLASQKFRDRATWLRDKWCGLLDESVSTTTATLQATELHRWTIHPDVDGCEPEPDDVPK